MSEMVNAAVVIANKLGLHARAATKFVQIAGKYACDVTVGRDGHEVNGKSIMGVLTLVASKGTTIQIQARGHDAKECVDALVQLVTERFGEDG